MRRVVQRENRDFTIGPTEDELERQYIRLWRKLKEYKTGLENRIVVDLTVDDEGRTTYREPKRRKKEKYGPRKIEKLRKPLKKPGIMNE